MKKMHLQIAFYNVSHLHSFFKPFINSNQIIKFALEPDWFTTLAWILMSMTASTKRDRNKYSDYPIHHVSVDENAHVECKEFL